MAGEPERVRVAIHIDVTPGAAGGTAQATQGLINALGQLEGPEEYVLVTQTPAQTSWIAQYAGANQQVVCRRARSRAQTGGAMAKGLQRPDAVRRVLRPAVERVRQIVGRLTPQYPTVPLSDGFYESLGCDVLHFPTQPFMICALPIIYNPHDLQHLHYPQFWPPAEVARREVVYRAACQMAQTIVVNSEWIKRDVMRQYAVCGDKVQIIPGAPPTARYCAVSREVVEEVRQRLNLPATYALYPAVTWPHKNHLRLLEALARLRDQRGLVVNLVCTGAKWEPYWSQVEQRVMALGMSSQVRFLGFLSETELVAVYRMAQFLVLPSLFEADSCPIYEAWEEGVPVASSNHTALPDQVGDAALLFDAKDVGAIVDAVGRMVTNAQLRRELVERGHQRAKDFDWTRTAKAYRAVYRRAAGMNLGEEDRWLLEWDWMREPQRRMEAAETV